MFEQLLDELKTWDLINSSINESSKFWGRYPQDTNHTVFRNAQTYIKLKIQRDLGYKIVENLDYHVGATTASQKGSIFHQDFTDRDDRFTFVLYMAPTWNTQFGGETVVYDPFKGEYVYSPYIPNGGVVFPAHWDHYGAAPNSYSDQLRITAAFRYGVDHNRPIPAL